MAGWKPGTRAALALVLAAACAGDRPAAPPPAAAATEDRVAADLGLRVSPEVDVAALALGRGVLAEVSGDQPAARAAFERVLGRPDSPGPVAARAALQLGWFELRAGHHRNALDLAARSVGLAPSHAAVSEGVAQLRDAIVAAAGAGDIRGPRLGTPLHGVPSAVAVAFAAAERALEAVTKLRPRPNIEAVFATIRYKEDATEAVVAKYRAVGEHGGLAKIASHYRAGSLYHDLAIALQFQLPPELEFRSRGDLRHMLRLRAVAYLKKAVGEYRACLAAPVSTIDAANFELWRLAAETDLRRASDALGGK